MLNKVLSIYTKYFAVWVVAFGALAYYVPGPFVKLKGGMEWFFALTMFGIGAVLSVDDFRQVARRPGIVALGCCTQFTVMPLGALALAELFRLPNELAVGLILTAAAPGAMASNVMCYIARADTAYSVSLTAVSTLLCPVLTAGITKLLAGAYLPVAFWPMFWSVVRMVILPLLLGLTVKHFLRGAMEKVGKVFPAISVTFIIFICSLVIALNRDYLLMITGSVLAVAVILNVYGMVMGYGVGHAFKLGRRRRRTLCIEIGMQNAGLGSVLALKHFGEKTALPAVIFVFVCIITAAVMVEVWNQVGGESKS